MHATVSPQPLGEPLRPYLAILVALVGASCAWACGDETPHTQELGKDSGVESAMQDAAHDAAHDAPQDDAYTVAPCPDSIPDFALGMQAQGEDGNLVVRLRAAAPSPPERFLNDWEVEVVDGEGRSVPDARIDMARPFMPVHGHDGGVAPVVRSLSGPGAFAVDGINLNMRGPWEVQFQIASPTAGSDYAVFHVCVRG